MTKKLVGADDATGYDQADSYFILGGFTAVATGNMVEFRVKASASGNIKCALYADNAGAPGALITAMNTGQAVVAGWNTLSFTSTSITTGTVVWLGTNQDIAAAAQAGAAYTGLRYFKVAAYSGFTFPNPAGSGFSVDTWGPLYAGWGSTQYVETGKLQVVLAAHGETEHLTLGELGREQVILAAQGEADSIPYLELGREQVILAAQGEAESLTLGELGREQVILAVPGEADHQAMVETARLQVVLAAQGKTDIQTMLETARLQVVLAVQGEAETLSLGELAREQVILAMLGEADQYGFIETGKLQVILAQIGISTVFNLKRARLQGAVRNLPSVRELEAL